MSSEISTSISDSNPCRHRAMLYPCFINILEEGEERKTQEGAFMEF